MALKRKNSIDIAKGIAMLAIVFGHCSSGLPRAFCYSFNSVIFFVLSGLTFCRDWNEKIPFKDIDVRPFKIMCRKIIGSLVIPYWIWGIISIQIYIIMILGFDNYVDSLVGNLGGLLYGNSESGWFMWYRPLWFLPCLAGVKIIWWMALAIGKHINRIKVVYTFTMVVSIIWMVLLSYSGKNLILPFEMETAFSMVFFFGLGIGMRENRIIKLFGEKVKEKKVIALVVGTLIAISNIGIIFLHGGSDTRADSFGYIYIYIYLAILGSVLVFMLAEIIGESIFLQYLGKRTLAVLVMHKFPIMFVETFFSCVRRGIDNGNMIVEIVVCITSILLCLLVERIVSKFVPFMFGVC